MALFSKQVKITPAELGKGFYKIACGEAEKLRNRLKDSTVAQAQPIGY